MTIYGKQTILTLLEQHPEHLKTLYLAKEIDPATFARLRKSGKPILRVDPKKAQAMAKGGVHQGFLADIEADAVTDVAQWRGLRRVVVLIGITDVGNIGAILRSACALGADAVAVCGIGPAALAGAAKASSGAIFMMPVHLCGQPMDLLNHLRQSGFALVGATLAGETDPAVLSGDGPVALVLGSESEGLPGKVVRILDRQVTIRMARGFDSLNVGAAAAILIDRMMR